ncbi:uncharacterized [Tachysurus ichikawai]
MRRTAGENNIRQAELHWPCTPQPSSPPFPQCREEKKRGDEFCATLKTGRRQQHKSTENGMLLFVWP